MTITPDYERLLDGLARRRRVDRVDAAAAARARGPKGRAAGRGQPAQRRARLSRGASSCAPTATALPEGVAACAARAPRGPIPTRPRATCSRSCTSRPPASTRATTSPASASAAAPRRRAARSPTARPTSAHTTSATPPAPRATISGSWRSSSCAARSASTSAAQLRILDVTDPIPPDGMVLAPPLDGRMQAAARDALLSLHDDAAGARALARARPGRAPHAGDRRGRQDHRSLARARAAKVASRHAHPPDRRRRLHRLAPRRAARRARRHARRARQLRRDALPRRAAPAQPRARRRPRRVPRGRLPRRRAASSGCSPSARFDVVVHLGALAGVRPSLQQPKRYQRVNIEGTLNLLEACRAHGVGRFVFASSSSVYGAHNEVPLPRARSGGAAGVALRRVQARRRALLLELQRSLRHRHHGAALLHRLRPAAAAGDGDPQVRAPHRRAASRCPSSATAARRATTPTSTTSSTAWSPRSIAVRWARAASTASTTSAARARRRWRGWSSSRRSASARRRSSTASPTSLATCPSPTPTSATPPPSSATRPRCRSRRASRASAPGSKSEPAR